MVVAVLPAPRHRASDRHRQRNRMPHNARAGITMGALALAAASMAASRWRCATAARWSCRRIYFAMPGPSGRPTSTAGRALESRSSISSCEVRTGVLTNLHRSRPRACAIPRQICRSSARLDQVKSRIEGHRSRGGLGRHDRSYARHHFGDFSHRNNAGLSLRPASAVTDLALGPRPASSPPTS